MSNPRTPAPETDTASVAADQLRSQVERIERLHADKKAIEDDLKEIYGEVKSAGFDSAVVRKIIKERAKDQDERAEEIAIFDLYWQAVHGSDEIGTTRATQARDARGPAKPISERAKSPSPTQTAPQKDWRDEAVSAEMAGSQKIAFEPSHPVRVSDGKGGSYFMRYDDFMAQKAAADAARALS